MRIFHKIRGKWFVVCYHSQTKRTKHTHMTYQENEHSSQSEDEKWEQMHKRREKKGWKASNWKILCENGALTVKACDSLCVRLDFCFSRFFNEGQTENFYDWIVSKRLSAQNTSNCVFTCTLLACSFRAAASSYTCLFANGKTSYML